MIGSVHDMTAGFSHPDAACKAHARKFLGEYAGNHGHRIYQSLRTICLACPGYEPCLAWAKVNWQAGFMAGLTERERARQFGVGDTYGAHPDVATIARAARGRLPEPEPGGRFAGRPGWYRVRAHRCATDGCGCEKETA